ncbi:hypothetical protein MMC07_009083 [Pseudocyphellaria aurata]|nr:hypothetical protein [Pseudocyphellaria aurata]
MSSPNATGMSDPEVSLTCHQWMRDLWDNLSARSTADDTRVNSINAKILGKRGAPIQRKLHAKLSETTCTLACLVENRPMLHLNRRDMAYREREAKLKANTLPTIFEGKAGAPTIPKMTKLSDRKNLATWVGESVEVYGKLLSSDLVDASIKPRIREIRQSLWMYRGTRNGLGTKRRHALSRSNCQDLTMELSVMLGVTTQITKYTDLLGGKLIDANFRPRLLAIVDNLKSFKENHFLIGVDGRTILNNFEREVRTYLATRAQA